MTNEPLVLVGARATSVLGEYDHQVEIPECDDFIIVYGPNGVGKTKFLEIVHAVSELDGRTLAKLPFESAVLQYSDGTEMQVAHAAEHLTAPDRSAEDLPIEFTLSTSSGRKVRWIHSGDELEVWLLEHTMWRPVHDQFWEDRRNGDIASFTELESRFSEVMESGNDVPEELSSYKRRACTTLIETQRLRVNQAMAVRNSPALRRRRMVKSDSRIADQASEMRRLVNEAQTSHSRITQQLDRTFPNRVLEASAHTSIDENAVRARYNEQNEFRSRLGRVASVALDDELSLPDRGLEAWELSLLNLYLDDTETKLDPFVLLLQKIELLEGIINSRLLGKRLQVTDAEGLKVVHEDDEREIDLESLSSGEQHEIILMFDLLFSVPKGAVVLIDEPEISLHVVWQLAFIPDVRRIAELAGFRFIVATHSPQIVNDSWARALSLGPAEAEFS